MQICEVLCSREQVMYLNCPYMNMCSVLGLKNFHIYVVILDLTSCMVLIILQFLSLSGTFLKTI